MSDETPNPSSTPSRPLVAGNWKMHRGGRDGAELASALVEALGGTAPAGAEVAVIPPAPALGAVADALAGSAIALGAQDCHEETSGAFTGCVATEMLADWGCTYVLCGHSERRQIFRESDAVIRSKVQAVLRAGLRPVLCVGETLEERDDGKTAEVLSRQVSEGTDGLEAADIGSLEIAYEPVWAIGTGRTATPEQAVEGHRVVRDSLAAAFGEDAAKSVRVLYGGSVKPGNAAELMAAEGVDGALVGGASLVAEDFVAIIEAASVASGG